MTHGTHLEKYSKKKNQKTKNRKPLLKYRAVILIPPDQNLGDGSDGLHQQVPVLFCDGGVFGQNVVQIPERKGKKREPKVTS